MPHITCHCCNTKTTCNDACNIQSVKSQTKFSPIIRDDTTFRWICPKCLAKLVPLVRQLHEFLKGDNQIYWNGLRHLLKESDHP